MKILVIEDNALNLELTREILVHAGYGVLEATEGVLGLDIAFRERPDLILVDLQLPGMDGLEVARRLRADDRTRGTPILAVTAHAMRGDDEKALAAGCTGFIAKPIDLHLFVAAVSSALKTGDS